MPTYPKTDVIKIDSIIMDRKICEGGAPIALRIPNSRVRSFTETNIILLTPTIPAIKVKMPIMETKIVIPPKIFIVSR